MFCTYFGSRYQRSTSTILQLTNVFVQKLSLFPYLEIYRPHHRCVRYDLCDVFDFIDNMSLLTVMKYVTINGS